MRTALPSLPARRAAGLLFILAAGCFGARTSGPMTDDERARRGAMTVLEGEELDEMVATGASLAHILSTRVPSIRELRGTGLRSNCPVFILRGNSSIQQVTEPDYYVDTTRANDSCILLTLSPRELRSIEVYASGSMPPGIVTAAKTGGAIVFRTRIR